MERARLTYVVTKLEQSGWILYRSDDVRMIAEGPFPLIWERARELALATAPALILAMNADGRAVAQEFFALLR